MYLETGNARFARSPLHTRYRRDDHSWDVHGVLISDHTPETLGAPNLVITAPHHTKHGAALRKVAYSIQYTKFWTAKFIRALYFRLFARRPSRVGLSRRRPALPRGPAVAPATLHGSGKPRRHGQRAEPPGRAACLSLETRPALPWDHRQPPAGETASALAAEAAEASRRASQGMGGAGHVNLDLWQV